MDNRILTTSEIADLNTYIYDRLRHEFGKQVNEDWCVDLTNSVVEEMVKIKNGSKEHYFAARNRKMNETNND